MAVADIPDRLLLEHPQKAEQVGTDRPGYALIVAMVVRMVVVTMPGLCGRQQAQHCHHGEKIFQHVK
jgi:hypothetical protein